MESLVAMAGYRQAYQKDRCGRCQLVLDDCECMGGPTWSVELLGIDSGSA